MRMPPAASLLVLAAALAVGGCATARDEVPAAPASAAAAAVPTQLPTDVRPLAYSISARPDAPNLRFDGAVRIEVEVLRPTDSITLNAADLELKSAVLTGPDGRDREASRISLDADKQTATMAFADRLAPGRYSLAITYSGKIYRQATGLFALDYESAEGPKRSLFTQFEAPDARRFFPGWDEPNFRTPYDLKVIVPAGQDAVSNMPQAGAETLADGARAVSFQRTPSMSSYLLFLAVGEFDRITTTAAGTEIGVVSKRGSGENGRWALEGSAQVLPFYNDYFGTPYPLPKLDNIAGPGRSEFFGAMENWGAIFSFESILLVDPAITTEERRQSIFKVAAHEIAHQWFGDLVTMAWWDDLWLNEGFASWMATKATTKLHPEWDPELYLVTGREDAMGLDSVSSTHPVVQRINTVEQISQAFDSITYRKGEAVITMLENYVGEDAWRRGVQDYIRAHRLGNTRSDDLWAKIEAAAGKPVLAIAHDFTLQPGVPLIRVESAECRGGKTVATLRQSEFSRDHQDKPSPGWRVPVIAAAGAAETRALVSGGAASVTVAGCGPLLVNSGQAGYYRTLYTPALLERLTRNYARLRPIDQIGLLADTWGLGLAGYQSAAEALDLIDAIPVNANSQLYGRAALILKQLHRSYEGDPGHQAMVTRFASARLSPALARTGWTARPGEPGTVSVLRATLIDALGAMGDAAVVAEANRRFAAGDASATSGPLRTTILAIVARNADSAGWERLRAQARAERNPLVRAELFRLLGTAADEALARRALALALTDEPGATTSSGMVAAVGEAHPDLALDFALANRDAVEAMVDASSRSRYFPALATASADRATIAKLRDYSERYMTPAARGSVNRAVAAIEDRIRVRETRLPDISRWLEARGG
jgi:aminopeptidase N